MTGVAIIKVSTPQAAILQIGSTATTITRLESRALVLQGVEGVGPPGPPGTPGADGADGPSDHGLLTGLGDDDHPQYVLDAGDTMTGTLTQTAASTTTPATRVNVSADTGYRMWIYGSGKVAWASHYDGPASAPRVTLIPYSESTVLHQAWTTFATDNASLTYNVLAVQVGNGGQPTIVMQSHGGTQASPTATTSGTTLGEVAFRGSFGTTGYGDDAPGAIAGWSGAAIRGWAVEGWVGPTNFGGMLTFETVARASGGGRQASVALYDGGQFVLDPAGQLGVLFGTYTLPAARLTVVSQATTETTAVLKAKASQTAKVLEVQDSSGTVVASITAAGVGAFAASSTVGGSLILVASDLDTDGTLAANSDSKIATQKATKTYADLKLAKASNLSDVANAATAFGNIKQAATTSATGVVELATAAETTTGTDTDRAVTPDGLAGSEFGVKLIEIMASDMSTAITTGDGKAGFMVPASMNGMNLIRAHAALLAAQSSSGTPTVQIRRVRSGTPADMLSTKITIDANESTSHTAATAPVVDTSNDDVATGDLIYVDVDVAGTGAKGLLVTLEFQAP